MRPRPGNPTTSEGTEYLRFPFGEALPADRTDARFVVAVGAALNDLLFVNRLLVPHAEWGLLRREPTPSENTYLLRLVVSCVHEFLVLIDKYAKSAESARLIATVRDGRGAGEFAALDRERTLRGRIKRIRDLTQHYPWPDESALEEAMTAVSAREGTVEAHPSSMASIRAVFADEVMTQFFLDPESDVDELRQLEELFASVSKLVTACVRLAQHFINEYFAGHPGFVVATGPV